MSYSSTPKVTVLSGAESIGSRSNRRVYLGLAGAVAVALLAGVGLKLGQARQASPEEAAQGSEAALVTPEGSEDTAARPTAADFASPFVAASPSLSLADPALLQSTPAQTRIPTVAAGRPDPFAPLVTPTVTPNRQSTAQRLPAPPPPAPTALPVASAPASLPALPTTAQPLPTVPVTATQGLPSLPPVTIPNLSVPSIPGGLPLVGGGNTTAMLPNPETLSVIDQVTVSGVVQIGQQVHAIVSEPGSNAGRRVAQGDAVAAGQVRVKAIDLSGPDPTVVLTYNGRDYYRSVGSGSL